MRTTMKWSSKICSRHFQELIISTINDYLEEMAKTIYDYWFVQFDFPDANGKPYKSSGGKLIWNNELNQYIPIGWNAGVLSDIADITMGQSPAGDSYNEESLGIPFYQGSTDFGTYYPTQRVYTTQPGRLAKTLDTLLSVRAPVGTLNTAYEDCCIGRGLAAIRHPERNEFIHYLLSSSKWFFDNINNTGTTFGSITKDVLYQMPVIIPPEGIISLFEKKIQQYRDFHYSNERETRELMYLRDWLLPVLMNGQATIED